MLLLLALGLGGGYFWRDRTLDTAGNILLLLIAIWLTKEMFRQRRPDSK